MKKLYLFTILLFTLGFFNIIFAWLGFICLITPFILLALTGNKIWCRSFCPRADFLTVILKGRSRGRALPKWFGRARTIFLIYFGINLFILLMSTLMVLKGSREAVNNVRFLIAFELPWDMPQLINIPSIPQWAIHLSFRIYSMMFTTTVIGLIIGYIYKPRTWCSICPVNTLSDMALRKSH